MRVKKFARKRSYIASAWSVKKSGIKRSFNIFFHIFTAMIFILLHRVYKRNVFYLKTYSFKILMGMTFKCHRNTKSENSMQIDQMDSNKTTFFTLSLSLCISSWQTKKEPMHSVVHVTVSPTKCRRRHSYAFAERRYGHIAMAGQGVPMHASRDDQSSFAVLFSIELTDVTLFVLFLGNFPSHLGPLLALRRRIDCAHHREYAVRKRLGRSNEWDDAEVSRLNGYIGAPSWHLCVGRVLAKGENSVSTIGSQNPFSNDDRNCDGFSSFQIRTECYDYLFAVAIEMKKCGLDPNETPAKLD